MKERKWKNLDQAGSQPDYQENKTFEFTCRDKNKDISHIRDQQKTRSWYSNIRYLLNMDS